MNNQTTIQQFHNEVVDLLKGKSAKKMRTVMAAMKRLGGMGMGGEPEFNALTNMTNSAFISLLIMEDTGAGSGLAFGEDTDKRNTNGYNRWAYVWHRYGRHFVGFDKHDVVTKYKK